MPLVTANTYIIHLVFEFKTMLYDMWQLKDEKSTNAVDQSVKERCPFIRMNQKRNKMLSIAEICRRYSKHMPITQDKQNNEVKYSQQPVNYYKHN